MNFVNKNAGIIALVAVVIAIAACFLPVLPHGQSVFGAVTGETNLDTLGISGLKLGSTCNNSFSSAGCQKVQQMRFSNCIVYAYATTIAASSTATVDCQAGTATLTALTGVQSGDTIMMHATTTLSSVYEGVSIKSYNASTTNGYITMTLFNGTGTTFTWSGAASSTMQYLDLR